MKGGPTGMLSSPGSVLGGPAQMHLEGLHTGAVTDKPRSQDLPGAQRAQEEPR